ncbi:MAG: diguanylate cyclase [Lysobacterales bacterium]
MLTRKWLLAGLLGLFGGNALAVPPALQDLFELSYTDPPSATGQIALLTNTSDADAGWVSYLSARALYYQNQFADSLSELIAIDQPEGELAARVFRLSGQNYYWLGSLNQALILAHRSNEVAVAAGMNDEAAQTENLIAAIHMKNGERTLALEFFTRALRHFESQQALVDIAKVQNNIGVLHIEEGQLALAEPFVEKALALGRQLDRPTTVVAALVNLIEIRTLQQRFAEAAALQQQCEEIAGGLGRSGVLVWCQEAAVETLSASGRLPEAIAAARDVLTRAEKQGLSQTGVDMARKLSALLAESGNLEGALEFSDRAFTDMLAVNEDLLALRVDQVDVIIAAEGARRELTTLRVQNEFQRQRQWLLLIGVVVLTPLLVWALVLVRSKQRLVNALEIAQEKTQAALTSTSEAKAAVERLARTDPLTGLNNRRAALAAFESAHTHWLKDHRAYSVLLLDLDRFKRINDQHGHAAGDLVLTSIASVLQDNMPKSGSCCRWGGEEFLILLPMTKGQPARKLAETLRDAIETVEVKFSGQVISPTVSIGVATVLEGQSVDELIRCADEALYKAKDQGRNRVV